MPADSEETLLRALRPGRDGVLLKWRQRRATFLPAVWETLSEPRWFLAELKRKAGLPADFWADDIVVHRYGTVTISGPARDYLDATLQP
jgi:AMMECR1 domain-containing protein